MTEKVLRGFASPKMADKRREISQKGGRSVPKEKRVFALYPLIAKEAARKGGLRRREANAQEIELLDYSSDGSCMNVPFQATGRTLRKVERLVKLGYWQLVDPEMPEHTTYRITQQGKDFLAWVETPEGQAHKNTPRRPRKRPDLPIAAE
jgi:general stress protein YciG